MLPISSYQMMIESMHWRCMGTTWCIMILGNPKNCTSALDLILRNINYLNRFTRSVVFFMPGFQNEVDNTISTKGYQSMFGFDENNFLDTIVWIEGNRNGSYRYSQDAEIVFLHHSLDSLGRSTFDFSNMISYNLDVFYRQGVNVLGFINQCMTVVNEHLSRTEIIDLVQRYINESAAGILNVSYHKEIKMFIAGSKSLSVERNAICRELMIISNRSTKHFILTGVSYEDFDTSFILEGRQEEYNRFIIDEADYVIFIIDQTIGPSTHIELELAINSYKNKNRPIINVYYREPKMNETLSKDVQKAIDLINMNHQYYVPYKDVEDLRLKFALAFSRYR